MCTNVLADNSTMTPKLALHVSSSIGMLWLSAQKQQKESMHTAYATKLWMQRMIK
jgi:hypothetical protein